MGVTLLRESLNTSASSAYTVLASIPRTTMETETPLCPDWREDALKVALLVSFLITRACCAAYGALHAVLLRDHVHKSGACTTGGLSRLACTGATSRRLHLRRCDELADPVSIGALRGSCPMVPMSRYAHHG